MSRDKSVITIDASEVLMKFHDMGIDRALPKAKQKAIIKKEVKVASANVTSYVKSLIGNNKGHAEKASKCYVVGHGNSNPMGAIHIYGNQYPTSSPADNSRHYKRKKKITRNRTAVYSIKFHHRGNRKWTYVRHPRRISARTKQIYGYKGADRNFILYFLNSGADRSLGAKKRIRSEYFTQNVNRGIIAKKTNIQKIEEKEVKKAANRIQKAVKVELDKSFNKAVSKIVR